MNMTICLVALSLLGADRPGGREAPAIRYQVRVLNMSGVEWRGAYYARLHPVKAQGGATVWTAGRETAQELAGCDPKGLTGPRVVTASQAPAHLFHRTNRKFSSGMNRMADGPFDHATQVAYTPSYEEVREGWAITLSGRKIDQGVLTCVVLDETTIAAVHQVSLSEKVGAKECCEGEGSCSSPSKKVACRIEVPEIAQTSLDGEWLIPNDGVLVVSLGARTRADEAGKAVVSERLILIEATPMADADVKAASLTGGPSPLLAPELDEPRVPAIPDLAPAPAEPAADARLPMPMPVVPSRSLPQARAVDGAPVTLPPLPECPATPSSLPGSAEPCASPQAPHIKKESSTRDAASAQAGYSSPKEKAGSQDKDKGNDKERAAEPDTEAPSRPCLFRIPVNAGGLNLEIEVRASLPSSTAAKDRVAPGEK